MSVQLNDVYKDPGRRLKGTGKTDAEQKAWEEERQRYQRQLVNLRKEVTMAAIREKESCIQLLQSPPEAIKDKIEVLLRQKEQLRHRLLTQNNEQYSTAENGPFLGNVWLAAQQTTEPSTTTFLPTIHGNILQNKMTTTTTMMNGNTNTVGTVGAMGGTVGTMGSLGTAGTMGTVGNALQRIQHYQQQPYANYVSNAVPSGVATLGRAGLGAAAAARPVAGISAGAPTGPIGVSIPAYGSVPAGPASFTYGSRVRDFKVIKDKLS